jgi:hypothetical protein
LLQAIAAHPVCHQGNFYLRPLGVRQRLFENRQSECLPTGQCACDSASITRWRDDPIGVGSHLAFAVH